jgi:hypothetical protein
VHTMIAIGCQGMKSLLNLILLHIPIHRCKQNVAANVPESSGPHYVKLPLRMQQ